ncbi:DUF1996 domain-containing protein [Lentzea albidocapillata]|uniref:DUF1996 domain-containing protein n=1 Tax=Lentzea albidocapillata TaxID=40571 RepID=UPI0004C304A9|nr:DUF1996 domain-containing protein [Lentzea albidocapillata]
MTHRVVDRRKFRLIASLSAVAVVAAGTATVALAAKDGDPAPASAFVRIEQVGKNVVNPKVQQGGTSGVFTVDCGTNEKGKFSADNPVAQPGLPHGAQHVHDFVGNLSISAESTDESLEDSETTCKNGDKSSYFWPVVRINPKANVNSSGSSPDKVKEAGTPHVTCPSVKDRLPAVPQQASGEVDRNLELLDKQLKEANDRVARNENPGGRLGRRRDPDREVPLGARRAGCRAGPGDRRGGPQPRVAGQADRGGQPADRDHQGAGRPELRQQRHSGAVDRGNATSKVTAMPKFLKMVVGDAKPTSRGPANARATWTCSGFEDRLSDKYVICPNGSKVMRVHDFAGCWDGKNADSANHRDHVAFADKKTGACPKGFKAIPQLRISISYDIARDVQEKGQYQLDAFPEENHNPFSDHNDFANVNSDQTMAQIVKCVNEGRRCG